MLLVLVLFEPVRSAEPPTISGTRRRPGSPARIRKPCAWRSSFGAAASCFFTACTAASSLPAWMSPRMRRSNSRRLAASSAASRCFHALRASAPRLPASRQARARRPEFRRRHRSSPAPRARPRSHRRRAASRATFRVPALVGAPKPIVVRQAIRLGRSEICACSIAAAIGFGIVAVDARRRPAGRLEALHLIDAVGERQRAVDGDAVVVEQHDQPVELQMPGERDGFLADAFHQVAVGGEHIGAVIDHAHAEFGGKVPLRHRHADRIGQAPGRAGRWWSRRPA